MRKLLGIVLGLTLIAGCKSTGATAPDSTSSSASVTSSADSTADASETAPPHAAETTTADDPPAADSDYAVTIDGSTVAKDYQGKRAVVVDFTFTNNSDKANSFAFATRVKAFQDGIELEDAMFFDDDVYDSANSMKDIKPGKSISVQDAFVLDSDADVEIEVTELISFDDALLASAVISVN